MNTKSVSEKYGVCFASCSRWAKENNVGRIQINGILAYDWTEEDCKRFEQRRSRGWQKGKPRK